MTRSVQLVVLLTALASGRILAQEPLGPADSAALVRLASPSALHFELIDGWYHGRPIRYYDLGLTDLEPGTLYRVRGGSEVLSTIPGAVGYSHVRQLYDVELMPGTEPDSVRSRDQILSLVKNRRARLTHMGVLVNAPVVPAGSTLASDPLNRSLRTAWYKGRPVSYFDFGPTRSAAAPMLEFARAASRAAGPPDLLDGQAATAGSAPGMPDYTDLWELSVAVVGPTYQLGSYHDYRKAMSDAGSGRLTLRRARGVMNRPVMYLDGQPVARPPALRSEAVTAASAKPAVVQVQRAGNSDSVAHAPIAPAVSAAPAAPAVPGEYPGIAGRVNVAVPRLEADVDIDGTLAEAAWSSAAVLSGFSQFQPVDGRPADDSTQVLVWYSPSAMYIGVRAFEAHGAVHATLADRDRIQSDDYVQILLDTFNNGRRAIMVGANPLGVQADGFLNEGGPAGPGGGGGGLGRVTTTRDTVDLSANFVFQSKGRVTEQGYEIEMRVPFKSLRYQSSDVQTWGINIDRKVQHSGHEDTWTPVRQANTSFLAQSGKLEGLTGLHRGLVLDLNPEMTSKVTGTPELTGTGWNYDASRPEIGGNLRWGITNNLNLSATANPDFSQVEADVQQIFFDPRNALFFPETRPFFLEGAEQFGVPNNLIYTRRVVSPVAAVKLSGKMSGLDVGLLSAIDDRSLSPTNDLPVFNLLRLRRDLGPQSTAGLVYTDRFAGSDFNRVIGADTRLIFGKLYSFQLQGAGSFTRTAGIDKRGMLWDAQFARSGRRFGIVYRFNGFHPDFETASGFISRDDLVNLNLTHRLTHFGKRGALLETWTGEVRLLNDWKYRSFTSGNIPDDPKVYVISSLTLRGGWVVAATVAAESWKYDPSLYTDYRLERTLPSGAKDTIAFVGVDRLDLVGGVLNVTTPRFARFSGTLQVLLSPDLGFLEWSRILNVGINSTVDWRPTERLRINARYALQRYTRTGDGSVVQLRHIPRLKIEYQVSRPIFIRFVGQYDTDTHDALRDDTRTNFPILIYNSATNTYSRATRTVSNNFRVDWLFSYRPTPGTVFFAGYGSSLTETDALKFRDLRRVNDGFFVKLSYLFRM